jgi:hypothetical protein
LVRNSNADFLSASSGSIHSTFRQFPTMAPGSGGAISGWFSGSVLAMLATSRCRNGDAEHRNLLGTYWA